MKKNIALVLAVGIAAIGLSNNTGAVAVNTTSSFESTQMIEPTANNGWTWRDFGTAAAGNAAAGAVAGGVTVGLIGTPAATAGAVAGGVAGAVSGAVSYGWGQLFGRSADQEYDK